MSLDDNYYNVYNLQCTRDIINIMERRKKNVLYNIDLLTRAKLGDNVVVVVVEFITILYRQTESN